MKNINEIIPGTFEEASRSMDPRIETIVMNSVLIGIITVLINKGIATAEELDKAAEDAYQLSRVRGIAEYFGIDLERN